MRARHFYSDGVGGKFDVFLAKEARHFEEIGFTQSDDFLTMRIWNFPSWIWRKI